MSDDLMGALLASLREHRAEQRKRDNEPCPKCGGDRLRTDFTGSGRCHSPLPATIQRGAGGMNEAQKLREAAAIGWDAAVEAMRYEDGEPVEIVSMTNPYRQAPNQEDSRS